MYMHRKAVLVACSPYLRDAPTSPIIRIVIRLLLPDEYAVHTEYMALSGQPGAFECLSHFTSGRNYRFKTDDRASQRTALIKAFNDFMLRSKSLLESNWTEAIVLD